MKVHTLYNTHPLGFFKVHYFSSSSGVEIKDRQEVPWPQGAGLQVVEPMRKSSSWITAGRRAVTEQKQTNVWCTSLEDRNSVFRQSSEHVICASIWVLYKHFGQLFPKFPLLF